MLLEPTIAPLTSAHKAVDISPAAFGELTDCTPLLDDVDALRQHMQDEGYLLLRGLLNRDDVRAARLSMLERLAEQGHLDPNYPLEEAKAAPSTKVAFKPDIAIKNPLVQKVVYDGPLMAMFDRFLGGPTRHFDYTWIVRWRPTLARRRTWMSSTWAAGQKSCTPRGRPTAMCRARWVA